MCAKEFIKVYKYCYNRIDFEKFAKLFGAIYEQHDENYLMEKFTNFQKDIGGFLVKHPEFLENVCIIIKQEGYNG